MPTATRTRTLAAPLESVWQLIGDPHHLPRWWPRVERVEDVRDGAFTEVMRTAKGKVVRADFELALADGHTHTLRWEQQLLGTPFEGLFSSAETEITLEQMGSGTQVTIELRQALTGGLSRITGANRLGSIIVRRAAVKTVEEALANLEQIVA
jgi:uncharacterized protein YndB with AHSA1/START domain